MASALIHMAVAKKANEKLGFQDENSLFLGTIAPDLGKLLGETKEKGHFETNNTYLPNLNKFLSKYKIDKPFEMGYYIHLYTDLIWFTEFMPNYYKNEILYLNDGTFMDCSFDLKMKKVYSDYSIFNGLVIDKYNLNLDKATPEPFGFKNDGTGFIGKSGKGRLVFNGDTSIITSNAMANNLGGMMLDFD